MKGYSVLVKTPKQQSRRIIMRIETAAGTPQRLDAVVKKYGSTHVSVCSRAITWVCGQDEEVQNAILGLLPAGYQMNVQRRALEAMLRRGG